jgi:hypothetical protein
MLVFFILLNLIFSDDSDQWSAEVCIYICICVHVFAYTYMYMHIYMFISKYIYISICIQINLSKFINLFTNRMGKKAIYYILIITYIDM